MREHVPGRDVDGDERGIRGGLGAEVDAGDGALLVDVDDLDRHEGAGGEYLVEFLLARPRDRAALERELVLADAHTRAVGIDLAHETADDVVDREVHAPGGVLVRVRVGIFGERERLRELLPAAAVLVEPPADRSLGGVLELGVEGGAGREAGVEDRLLAVVRDEAAAHLLDEVRGEEPGGAALTQLEGLGLRFLGFLAGDHLLDHHAVEDVVATAQRALGVAEGVVGLGPLDQARDQRRLREVELRRALAEVVTRRGLDAVASAPEVYPVAILGEDLLLAVVHLDLRRVDRLECLAVEGLPPVQELVPRELHRDRARPFRAPQLGHVLEGGARDGDGVDAEVAFEARILRSDDRLDQMAADPSQRDREPLLLRVAVEIFAVSILQDRDAREVADVEPVDVRQVAEQEQAGDDAGDQGDRVQGPDQDPRAFRELRQISHRAYSMRAGASRHEFTSARLESKGRAQTEEPFLGGLARLDWGSVDGGTRSRVPRTTVRSMRLRSARSRRRCRRRGTRRRS